jgi:hypothetical protein
MKFRRHTNNKGRRQMVSGSAERRLRRFARRLGVEFRVGESKRLESNPGAITTRQKLPKEFLLENGHSKAGADRDLTPLAPFLK